MAVYDPLTEQQLTKNQIAQEAVLGLVKGGQLMEVLPVFLTCEAHNLSYKL